MPSLALAILLLVLLALCLLSAAMSAIETALLCLKEHQVKSLAGDNAALGDAIRRFARSPERHLNQVILLNTPVQLAIAAIILFLLGELGDAWTIEPLPAALLTFAAVVILIELLPTLAGASRPETVFRLLALPLQRLDPVLDPCERALSRLTAKATSAISLRLPHRGHITEEEIETLVEVRRDEGILDQAEAEVIQEILKLGNKTAKDCMTPRVDAAVLSIDVPPAEADRFIREHRHWHLPVCREEDPDNIIGILDVRSWLIASSRQGSPAELSDFVRPPVFVPETMPALEVFRNFLGAPRSLAIVLDEFGGLEGVISQNDIVEAIIGEAAPQPGEQLEIQDLGKNRLLVTGAARLDEIGDLLDLDLESEGLDTIGGLLFNALDRLPAPGEVIALEGAIATVRRTSARRVEEVLIERSDSAAGPALRP